MKKFTTLKTLLVGLCTMGATSAWADLVPKTESCDFEDGEILLTASGRMTGENVEDPANEVNHVYKFTTSSNAANVAPGGFGYYDFTSLTSTASKVDISFDCFIPQVSGQVKISFGDATKRVNSIFGKGAWGYSSTGAIFAFGSERGKLNGSANENYAKVNETSIGSTTTLKANEVLGLWVSVSATVDITNKTVSYVLKNKSTDAELVSATNAAFLDPTVTVCTQLDIQSGVNSISAYIDNLSITSYTDASEKFANYTIQYKYSGTSIKSDRVVESARVGNTTTILDSDKNAIWYGEPSVKYIYESDDADSQTVSENGNTVVTVLFRKATKYNYVLNAVDEEEKVIKKLDEGNAFEGDKAYARGVKAFYKDGTLYSTDAVGGFEKEFTEAGTQAITYKENTTWAYFTEVEDMNVSRSWAKEGDYPSFYSNAKAVRLYAGAFAYTEPLTQGGTFKVTMWARNGSSKSSDNVGLYYRDADGNLVPTNKAFVEWGSGERTEHSVEGVGIPAGCAFVLKNESAENNSNLEMDYIILEKTSDEAPAIPNRTATIGQNGYTTFASAYNVSLPTGVTAYTAKVNEAGTYVNFTEITSGTIPANNGVLLEGNPGDITLTVVDSASPLTDNDFIAGTGAAPSDNTKTYFAMVKDSDPLAFCKIAAGVVVPANKAYLAVAASAFVPESARLTVTFDGEATGIKTVENAKAGKAIYNLNGQRVDKAQKGLYIVNGKKTIIK